MILRWSILLVVGSTLTPVAQPAHPVPPASTNAAPVASSAALSPDPFSDPLIKQIEARQKIAVAGDAKETKALTDDLRRWTTQQPGNHLLQAYLGSLYTLCSRDAWPGPGKLEYLREGGRLLDAAVSAEPLNPAIRFVRAIDFFALPSIFGKRQVARDDFAVLLKQANGEMKIPFQMDTDTAQAIYYYAGLSLKQQWLDPQARDAWQRGWKLDPASPLAAKIHGELANLK